MDRTDKLLLHLYHHPTIQAKARSLEAHSRHRRSLLTRYSRLRNVLNSKRQWRVLIPWRRHRLEVLVALLDEDHNYNLRQAVSLALKAMGKRNTASWMRGHLGVPERNH